LKKLTRSIFIAFVVAVGASALAPAQAADAEKPAVTVFTNVKVFNGSDDKLIDADVLIEGNLIKQVSTEGDRRNRPCVSNSPDPLCQDV